MDFKILAALLLTFAIAEASVIREEDGKFSAFFGMTIYGWLLIWGFAINK